MPLGMRRLSPHPALNWDFATEPEPHCHNREIFVPRGKVLGGTSSINAMIYARGHPLDYDQWRQAGLTGWGYADVLPYFKRSENNWRGEDAYHGGARPAQGLARHAGRTRCCDLFTAAAAQVRVHRRPPITTARSPKAIAAARFHHRRRAAPFDRARLSAPGDGARRISPSRPARSRIACW